MNSIPTTLPDTLQAQLERDVVVLAGEIGERNLGFYDALEAAAKHVENAIAESGCDLTTEEYEAKEKTVRNIIGNCPGASPDRDVVIIGAHYDSAINSPGANDNATGVAALLALARMCAPHRWGRNLRFVAFVNEESPYYRTSLMGSVVHATGCKQRGERVRAMLSLETIGYYTDRPKSQYLPFPFNLLHSNRGNFIGFVSSFGNWSALREVFFSFKRNSDFPAEFLPGPGFLPGVGASDHWAFWKQGYPGVMVTDSANFRYRHFHTPSDTPDKIKYPQLAQVVLGLYGVIREIAKAEY